MTIVYSQTDKVIRIYDTRVISSRIKIYSIRTHEYSLYIPLSTIGLTRHKDTNISLRIFKSTINRVNNENTIALSSFEMLVGTSYPPIMKKREKAIRYRRKNDRGKKGINIR